VLQAIEERDKDGKLLRTRFFDGNSVKRWGWHKLRHSLALAGSSGVDVKTVSSPLRHSNVRKTLGIYTR
jgi:integrase